jgi:hypothetical protein
MASIDRDWRIELIEAHPNLFHAPVGAPKAAQGYPTCSDGWCDLLERLFTRIEAAIAEDGGSLRVIEIKEKYGIVSNAKGYGPWLPGRQRTSDNPNFDPNYIIEI